MGFLLGLLPGVLLAGYIARQYLKLHQTMQDIRTRVAVYDTRLNNMEQAPTGDDYNSLYWLVMRHLP
ncbi:hypothetical protein QBC99_002475 [Beijerinckia sp. GAS462]|nr:hypothetical protein [Beijerinckia sp. GAS462]SEC43987.1 hypothetical protein SAMN05443249_2694 [Beijerinckia sp. 28-YEA-48]